MWMERGDGRDGVEERGEDCGKWIWLINIAECGIMVVVEDAGHIRTL